MRLGSLDLPAAVPLFLAPLAGYSDAPLRLLCRRLGAEVTVSEMASADGLVMSRRRAKGFAKTIALLDAGETDTPFFAQLFGKDPDRLAEAVRIVENERRVDGFDLNAGCPVKKVVASGHGVALMRDPVLLAQIVAAMRAATTKPLTVKLRAGAETINVVQCARLCADAGADAITVHPRTRAQMFAGLSDWSLIAAVKDAVGVPVIGNGDVVDGESARQLVADTGCDGVMIGRAAMKHPWVFAPVRAALDGRTAPPFPDGQARQDMLRFLLEQMIRFKGEKRATFEIRKYALHMVKGFPGAAAARHEIATSPDPDTLLARTAEVLGSSIEF